MFKTKEEIIIIQAETKEPIPTRAVFWSHDKGTAKMLFKLRKDGTSQSLAEGTIVPVVLDFNSNTAENGRGRHIYHAVIEDAVNGIVSIVLEDNILGYQGRVDGSIYIELPDSRSLDTAGRFTFHIKRSPIDEDVPELEDYYWQGFGDIMEQYHESIAEIKLEAKTLIDSLTSDVTTAKTKVTQLEQSITTANTNLNTRIDEINKKIDDNDVFTKAESSANVISQVIGKEKVQLTFKTDFLNKETGNFLENKNIARVFVSPTLGNPSTSGNEIGRYDQVSALDGVLYKNGNNVSGSFTQLIAQYDLIELITRLLDERFWIDLGAITILEKANVLKSMLKRVVSSAYGFGKNQDGYKYSQYRAVYNTAGEFTGWALASTHNNSVISKINVDLSTQSQFSTCIDKNGYFSVAIVSEKSDGSTYSELNTDYLHLEFTIELSANEHIKSMIAQNHVTNLATQTEATTATDNTKTMTPLRTKQLLDAKLLNMVYPIGSIYMSVNSATPATLFGGTWERFSKGRVLVGVDESDTVLATSGKQGGSTNPLTTHTHTTQLTTYRVTSAGSGAVNNLARSTDQGNAATGEFGATSSAGDNTDHNNWQPFTTVYMWKRTA